MVTSDGCRLTTEAREDVREMNKIILGRQYYEEDFRSEITHKDGRRENLILGKKLGGLVKSWEANFIKLGDQMYWILATLK